MIDQLLQQVSAEAEAAREVTDTVKLALRALAKALPDGIWRYRRTGWYRTHYADCNANGKSGYRLSDRADVIGIRGYKTAETGGQNAGAFELAENDDSLFLTRDGRLETATSIEGHWSCWQGSSSAYTVSFGEALAAYTDEELQNVVEKVQERLEEYRAAKVARHAAGAAYARQLLAALKGGN